MKASTLARNFTKRFKCPLAAVSVIAGVITGILGNLLTSHWRWGIFCGLLVLTAFLAAAEAFKARDEGKAVRPLVINSPALGLPYASVNYTTGDSYGPNASVGTSMLAGKNINDRRKYVYRRHETTIKVGGFSLVALIALIIAVGGTIHMHRNPGDITLQAAAALAAEGGHGSPAAAVKGFFGNVFQNNWTDACSYEPPSEQDACSYGTATGNSPEIGSLAVGNAIIEGARALVPISGRLCRYGECRYFQGRGIPQGYTFQTAYADAYDSPDSSANLVPCQEVDSKWYVNGVNP